MSPRAQAIPSALTYFNSLRSPQIASNDIYSMEPLVKTANLMAKCYTSTSLLSPYPPL